MKDPPAPVTYTLSLHDALPISLPQQHRQGRDLPRRVRLIAAGEIEGRAVIGLINGRSEEHTSELQSRVDLVCRLLLEKKNEPVSSASRSAVSQVAGYVVATTRA